MNENPPSDTKPKLSKLVGAPRHGEPHQSERLENVEDESGSGQTGAKINDNANSSQPKEQTAKEHIASDVKPLSSKEINGPKGLEPTRYGDWESKGCCYDF